MRIGENIAWVEEAETYREGNVRGIFEGTVVVNTPTLEGFGLHIIPHHACVPRMEPHWRDLLEVGSRLHVFCEGLWLPGKVLRAQPEEVEVALALTRKSKVYPKNSERLAMVPPNLYDEGLWVSDIAFEVDDPGPLWGCWEKDGVIYEMVDEVFGTAVLYAVGGNEAVCIPRDSMEDYTLIQEAQTIQPPQVLTTFKMPRGELSSWCPINEPGIMLEILRDRSHTLDGSREKQWMCRFFNMHRFSVKFHPSNHHRSVGSFGGPLVLLQTMIDLLTPYGSSDRALRFACMSAMFPAVFQKAMVIRLREEELAYLRADLSLSTRFATWRISWTGAPVRDVRHQLLHVTPFLRDLGVIHLPNNPFASRITCARFTRLACPTSQTLRDLILGREHRNIASAFSTSALGPRFYDLCLGFVAKPPPIFGGAISCSPLDVNYREVFAGVCKEKGGTTLVVSHVNCMHHWVKAFRKEEVPVHFGCTNIPPGVQVISYHAMRHLYLSPVDRVIFEDSHMFGASTGIVRHAERVEAQIRWCVSKMPRTSFPALHGTMRMLRVSPFTRRDVSWNNAVDRSISVLGTTPYYNLLKRIFVVAPEAPAVRPTLRNCVVEVGELAKLLRANRQCAAFEPRAFLHVQSAMLSSTLLPLQGFSVSSDAVSLEEELGRRGVPLVRREEIRKEMKDKCPVCLEHVDEWRLSACNHVLCPQCVDCCRTMTQNTCPICRAVWHLPFVNPMGEDTLRKFKEANTNLLGHWVPHDTKRLWEAFKVGPKAYEIQRLLRQGMKTLVICAHKSHASFLGKFLDCPYLCTGLKPAQRWASLETYEVSGCLVCTPDTFQWSVTLTAERVIFAEPPSRSQWRRCIKSIRPKEVCLVLAAGFPDCTQAMTCRRSTSLPPAGFNSALSLVYDAVSLLV